MFQAIQDFSLELIASLLAFFYSLPVVGGSYGVAIMLLTAAVMMILMPLTLRATRSTIKMTQLQPEMRALQKKHADDKQALNQEMMQLYSEHGVNPVGGCLPVLAQLPVFLILFNVLRGLTRRVEEKPYFAVSEEANRLIGGQTSESNTFDPANLDKSTELYLDLSQDTEMNFLGVFDLSLNPWDVVQSNFLASLPYVGLIVFVVATSYYQQRQISARRGSIPDNPTPQQQTQQQLLRILPLMSGIWSFLFPAGLVLYWATSNVFRIGQQSYITRALYSGDGPGAQLVEAQAEEAAKSDGDEKKSGGKKGGATSDAKNGSGTDSIGDVRPGRSKSGSGKSAGKSGGKKGGKSKVRSGGETSNGSGNGSASEGDSGQKSDSDGSGNGAPVDRNEAWAKKRAQRVKTQEKRRTSGGGTSSRTTPKGTKPSDNRKKRRK